MYATYQQGGSALQVAIHDMGNAENAQALFTFELPVSRIEISRLPSAVVDMGLPSAYAAYAWTGQYVIEISMDDHSDAALTYIETFALTILKGGCVAETDAGGAPDLAPETIVLGVGSAAYDDGSVTCPKKSQVDVGWS